MKELLKFKIAFAIVGVLTIALIVGVVLFVSVHVSPERDRQFARKRILSMNDQRQRNQENDD